MERGFTRAVWEAKEVSKSEEAWAEASLNWKEYHEHTEALMRAAVAGAVSASVVKRNLGEKFAGQIFAIDSTVVLFWISQESKPFRLVLGTL